MTRKLAFPKLLIGAIRVNLALFTKPTYNDMIAVHMHANPRRPQWQLSTR